LFPQKNKAAQVGEPREGADCEMSKRYRPSFKQCSNRTPLGAKKKKSGGWWGEKKRTWEDMFQKGTGEKRVTRSKKNALWNPSLRSTITKCEAESKKKKKKKPWPPMLKRFNQIVVIRQQTNGGNRHPY